MEENGKRETIIQGYSQITKIDRVTMVAQTTTNTLNEVIKHKINVNAENYTGDIIAIKYAGTINIGTFPETSNNKLIECIYKPLLREGVESLHELVG